MKLTPQQIETFFDRGYIILPNVFSAEEIKNFKSESEQIYQTSRQFNKTCMHNNSRFVYQGNNLHRVVWCGAQSEVLLKVGEDSRITGPVSQLLESNQLIQLINQLHFKMPGDNVQFPFHQDSENRGHGTNEWTDLKGTGSYVQTTLALDPMTANNGPLIFIPFSGKDGHLDLNKKSNYVPNMEKAHVLTLEEGSLALFGPYTIHGSYPNESGYPRRVLINGYAYPGANNKSYPGCGTGKVINI